MTDEEKRDYLEGRTMTPDERRDYEMLSGIYPINIVYSKIILGKLAGKLPKKQFREHFIKMGSMTPQEQDEYIEEAARVFLERE